MTLVINKKTYEADELIAYVKKLEKENTALRQDWEIMKNTIADYNDFCDKYMKLEKENAELKETVTKMNNVITETFSNLTKAKELLKRFIETSNPIYFEEDRQKVKAEAEQFIKDNEVKK